MPGMNGTGPLGQGPLTGRGQGRCGNAGQATGQGMGVGFGRRAGFGGGMGQGRGVGRGFSLRRWFGLGQRPTGNPDISSMTDEDILKQRLESIEAEAESIRKRLGDR